MNIREKAQKIIDARTAATQAPIRSEGIGSEGYNLYADVRDSYPDVVERLGFSGRIGEIRGSEDWAQLRGNAEYIEAAWNGADEIARKLIGALDTIQAMCDAADRYEAHARAHPERDHALAWANGADNAVTAGRLFLARLDEKGDGEE